MARDGRAGRARSTCGCTPTWPRTPTRTPSPRRPSGAGRSSTSRRSAGAGPVVGGPLRLPVGRRDRPAGRWRRRRRALPELEHDDRRRRPAPVRRAPGRRRPGRAGVRRVVVDRLSVAVDWRPATPCCCQPAGRRPGVVRRPGRAGDGDAGVGARLPGADRRARRARRSAPCGDLVGVDARRGPLRRRPHRPGRGVAALRPCRRPAHRGRRSRWWRAARCVAPASRTCWPATRSPPRVSRASPSDLERRRSAGTSTRTPPLLASGLPAGRSWPELRRFEPPTSGRGHSVGKRWRRRAGRRRRRRKATPRRSAWVWTSARASRCTRWSR